MVWTKSEILAGQRGAPDLFRSPVGELQSDRRLRREIRRSLEREIRPATFARRGRRLAHHRVLPGIRTLAALFVLREKVLKPVLAAAGTPKPGRPPTRIHPLDAHYENLQRELRRTLETLGLAT